MKEKSSTILTRNGERMKGKMEKTTKQDTLCNQAIEISFFQGMEQEIDFSNSWTQETMQIIYILQGEAYFDCNEKQYEIKEQEFLLIHPYEMYFFQPLTPKLAYYVIRFSPFIFVRTMREECFEKYIKPIATGTLRFQNYLKEETILQKDVRALIQESEKKEVGYELMMQSLLYKIITNLIRNHICTMCSKREIECVKKNQSRFLPMFEYLKEHYSEKIQLTDMAEFADVTSCHFCRTFKHISNKTFVDYLNSIRLVNACKELAFSLKPVKQIACMCGFEDMNYFIRIFKKYYKVTPNQFRKIWIDKKKEGLKERT